MDILRKELNSIYESQHLENELLDRLHLLECKRIAATIADVSEGCTVITDASVDRCYIYGGALAAILGLCDEPPFYQKADSSDEDLIYNHLHPEDLAEKRMLEYEFFKRVDSLLPEQKQGYAATCRIRMRDARGEYLYIDNSTQVIRTSPEGKIWLILCCYTLSTRREPAADIDAAIVNRLTGGIRNISLGERRGTCSFTAF